MENSFDSLKLSKNRGLVTQLKEFQRNPKSLVFVSLAEEYRREGLPAQALEILAEGLSFHPDLASALLVKARCLFDLKKYADTLQVIKKILQFNPEHLKAHKLQAQVYVRLGQRPAAVRSLYKVLQIFPQDREAQAALAEIKSLEAKRSVELLPAAEILPKIEVKPGKIEEFHVGTFTEALPKICAEEPSAAVVDQEEENFEPTFATRTIAELYLRQGLSRKAHKVLRQLLRDDPTNDWARSVLQDLKTDEIVLPDLQKTDAPAKIRLEKKLKVLERMLAHMTIRRGDVRNRRV